MSALGKSHKGLIKWIPVVIVGGSQTQTIMYVHSNRHGLTPAH